MAGSYYSYGFRDSSNEVSVSKWNVGDLTPVTLATALTEMGNLATAMLAVTLGTGASSGWGDNDQLAVVRPTAAECQRGIKWTVAWQDTVTGSKGNNYIPTANLSLLPLVGGVRSEDLDISAGVGLALKQKIEALCKSPAGNAILVYRIYYAD